MNTPVGNRTIELIRNVSEGAKKFYILESDLLVVDIHNNGDILSNLRLAMLFIYLFNAFPL